MSKLAHQVGKFAKSQEDLLSIAKTLAHRAELHFREFGDLLLAIDSTPVGDIHTVDGNTVGGVNIDVWLNVVATEMVLSSTFGEVHGWLHRQARSLAATVKSPELYAKLEPIDLEIIEGLEG